MEKLNYYIDINATKPQVWDILIGDESYKKWVKAFSANSSMRGEWVQGTTVDFIDPNLGGTRAILEVVEPEQKILAKHIALISKEGEVSKTGEMADKWLGTVEEYQLKSAKGKTTLFVEIVTHQDFADMFNSAWPNALQNIKQLCEQH